MNNYDKYFDYVYVFIMYNLPYFFVYLFNFESKIVFLVYVFVEYQSMMKENMVDVIELNLDEKLFIKYTKIFQFIILTPFIVISGLSGTLYNFENKLLFICLCYFMTIMNFIIIVKFKNIKKTKYY